MTVSTTGVLAMEEYGEIAGTASSLMGTLQTAAGLVVMWLAGLFYNGTAMPMVVAFAGCATATLVLTLLTIRGESPPIEGPIEIPAE